MICTNTSDTRGNSPSYGTNYQKVGHDLASVDDLAVLDGGKCILQLRGVRPFKSDKYDLTQHPNYKLTAAVFWTFWLNYGILKLKGNRIRQNPKKSMKINRNCGL